MMKIVMVWPSKLKTQDLTGTPCLMKDRIHSNLHEQFATIISDGHQAVKGEICNFIKVYVR